MPNSYRELTAPELVSMFLKIKGGYINKGRDAHMLSLFMKERGATPTQILYAMYLTNQKDIPSLLREDLLASIMSNDLLLMEAGLVVQISDQEEPLCFWTYADLLDQNNPNAQSEAAFVKAKEELERWINDAFARAPSINSRSRPAREHNIARAINESSS